MWYCNIKWWWKHSFSFPAFPTFCVDLSPTRASSLYEIFPTCGWIAFSVWLCVTLPWKADLWLICDILLIANIQTVWWFTRTPPETTGPALWLSHPEGKLKASSLLAFTSLMDQFIFILFNPDGSSTIPLLCCYFTVHMCDMKQFEHLGTGNTDLYGLYIHIHVSVCIHIHTYKIFALNTENCVSRFWIWQLLNNHGPSPFTLKRHWCKLFICRSLNIKLSLFYSMWMILIWNSAYFQLQSTLYHPVWKSHLIIFPAHAERGCLLKVAPSLLMPVEAKASSSFPWMQLSTT